MSEHIKTQGADYIIFNSRSLSDPSLLRLGLDSGRPCFCVFL